MTQSKTVTVHILDKEYCIASPQEERANLESAARYLDGKMREIRTSGKVIGADRVAVMAALNITHDLLHKQQRLEQEAAATRLQAEREALRRREQTTNPPPRPDYASTPECQCSRRQWQTLNEAQAREPLVHHPGLDAAQRQMDQQPGIGRESSHPEHPTEFFMTATTSNETLSKATEILTGLMDPLTERPYWLAHQVSAALVCTAESWRVRVQVGYPVALEAPTIQARIAAALAPVAGSA